jgi:hypothetical protein
VNGGPVSGLKWMQAVRDSSDIFDAAAVPKYRRDHLGDPEAPRYVKPQTVKFVALALGSFMNEKGVAEVGLETLHDRYGLAPRTVQRACVLLVTAGWLRVSPGGRGAKDVNVYTARIPANATYIKSRRASRVPTTSRGPTSASPGPPKKAEEETPPRRGKAVGELRRAGARETDAPESSPDEHLEHLIALVRAPQLFGTNRGAYREDA